MKQAINRVIEDTIAICIEILGNKALCRECTIDPQGSLSELDFRSFSSDNPQEISEHFSKHILMNHEIDPKFIEIEFWQNAINS